MHSYLLSISSQSGLGLEAKIHRNIEDIKYSDYSHISLSDLPTFPAFLRFDIELFSSWSDVDDEKAWDTQSIAAKCQFLEEQLKLIKPTILSVSELCFYGQIDKNNSSRFSDHSELLNFLRNRLLPICDGEEPRAYGFVIVLYSEKSAGRCVLSSLLQIPEIDRSSQVEINIYDAEQTNLPIGEISNWLHRKCDVQRERSLFIFSSPIENLVEMFNQLKAVIISILYCFCLKI